MQNRYFLPSNKYIYIIGEKVSVFSWTLSFSQFFPIFTYQQKDKIENTTERRAVRFCIFYLVYGLACKHAARLFFKKRSNQDEPLRHQVS